MIGVIGDGVEVAVALQARGRTVLGPAEVQAALDERANAAGDAGAAAARARARAEEGRRALYVDARFRPAREALSDALDQLLAEGVRDVTTAELARVALDLGVAALAAGETREAERQVELALRLVPALTLEPELHGPPVQELVARVRSREARQGATRRSVVTEPPAATVTVDGRACGASPIALDLAVGLHIIAAEGPGRAPAATLADVGPGSAETIRLALPAAVPALAVRRALESGRLEEAARVARAALDLDVVVAVARGPGGWTALRVDGRAATHRVRGTNPAEVAAALGAPTAPEADPPSGGVAWWVWAAGGLAAAGVAIGVFVAVSSSEPDHRVLVLDPEP